MDIIITLTTAGSDQGTLFDLYSNVDGYTTPFETDVAVASLIAGYTTSSAPAGTTTVRVCGKQAKCPNCIDIVVVYTTTTSTTTPPIACNETTNSGGEGVTEYTIPLETAGGLLVFDFNAYGIPDKLEILHNTVKVATTGMTVANAGPFDNLYGDPTVPTGPQVLTVDQFIGTQKAIPPTREAEIFSDTGKTYIVSGQQLVWWTYDATDVLNDPNAIVRITGPAGTAWQLKRLCEENTTTTTTTSTSSTTTTTTTAAPTTTTTTTLTGLIAGFISLTTDTSASCIPPADQGVYLDLDTPGTLTAGDTVYTDSGGTSPYFGNGDYYKIDVGTGTEFSARVTALGVVLSPITSC